MGNYISFVQRGTADVLNLNIVYEFVVVYAHYILRTETLQLVFRVKDHDSGKAYYLLEEFQVGTPEYTDLLMRTYCADFMFGAVAGVSADDFLDFGGDCKLHSGGNRLHIDMSSISCDMSPYSRLFTEQDNLGGLMQ